MNNTEKGVSSSNLELVEATAVQDSGEHSANVKLHARVGGHQRPHVARAVLGFFHLAQKKIREDYHLRSKLTSFMDTGVGAMWFKLDTMRRTMARA